MRIEARSNRGKDNTVATHKSVFTNIKTRFKTRTFYSFFYKISSFLDIYTNIPLCYKTAKTKNGTLNGVYK